MFALIQILNILLHNLVLGYNKPLLYTFEMKIAFISTINHPLPPQGLGWETNAYYLIKKLQEKNIDVTVYASGDSKIDNLRSSVKYSFENSEQLGVSEYFKYEHISKVFQDNLIEKYDLIHGWYNYEQIIFSKFAPNTPVLTTFHGIRAKDTSFFDNLYSNLSNNNYLAAISKDNMNIFPKARWVGVAYHGLHLQDYPFIQNPEDYFCVVGRVGPEKGIAEIVQIAIKLSLNLKIAGNITHQDYFDEKIKPFLNNKIEYLGLLNYESKIQLFAKAKASFHFAIYPFREAFGNTLTESMACGTPVIALTNGAIPEIVIHNKTGFVIEKVENVIEFVSKINQIKRLDCRKHVELNFTDEQMAKSYIEIYNKLIIKNDS